MNNSKKYSIIILSLLPIFALAEDQTKQPSPWDGSSISLGGVLNTGNTDTSSSTGSLSLLFDKDKWNNTLIVAGQYGRSDGETNAQMYTIDNMLKYSCCNPDQDLKNYLFLDSDINVNQFSSYNYQTTLSLGYGRDWIKNDKFTLSTNIAPGYNKSSVADTDETSDSWSALLNSTFTWKLSKSSSLEEDIKYQLLETYWTAVSTSSINSTIIGNLALKLSYNISYLSKIPEGSSYTYKTNSITTISMVYNF